MEQERYNWMWSKRKEGFNSHVSSYGDSWEEQAFAEDAAGPHGGCIWPPRSYTCSFCRREFRSAQALGGHMNVHRRDRARLKQNPNPNINLDNHHNQILNPSQNICLSMVSNPNNSDHLDHAFLGSPSSISSSRVSNLPTPNINDKRTFLPPFSSAPFIQESLKSISTTPISSWSNLDPKICFQIQGLEKEKGSKVFESNSCIAKKNQATNDLSMNLNLVIRQSCEMAFDDKDDDDDPVVLGCKRRRIDETISFFPKRVLVDRDHQPESVVLDEQSSSSTEILDLELRLGDRPK